jgi:hypothetical protein
MLIKQREQEQNRQSNSQSAQDDIQKRGKKRKAAQKSQSIAAKNGSANTHVASIDGDPSPSTDTLPAVDDIMHNSSPKPKSRPRARPKPRRGGKSEAEAEAEPEEHTQTTDKANIRDDVEYAGERDRTSDQSHGKVAVLLVMHTFEERERLLN